MGYQYIQEAVGNLFEPMFGLDQQGFMQDFYQYDNYGNYLPNDSLNNGFDYSMIRPCACCGKEISTNNCWWCDSDGNLVMGGVYAICGECSAKETRKLAS